MSGACTVWIACNYMLLWERNVLWVEVHIAVLDSFTLRASLDKKNWAFNYKKSHYLPGHPTTHWPVSFPFCSIFFFVWRCPWSLSSDTPPSAPALIHGPSEALPIPLVMVGITNTLSTQRPISSLAVEWGGHQGLWGSGRFGLESRLRDATLRKLLNISEPHFTYVEWGW